MASSRADGSTANVIRIQFFRPTASPRKSEGTQLLNFCVAQFFKMETDRIRDVLTSFT